jgi:hypothetical protein
MIESKSKRRAKSISSRRKRIKNKTITNHCLWQSKATEKEWFWFSVYDDVYLHSSLSDHLVTLHSSSSHYVENALFSVQMLIDHVNLNTFFKNKKLNKKKTRWWKKLNDLNLHIEYKSNKQNSADDSSRRLDYESNESIIVNAIANDVNTLIMNRVNVHVYNVEHDLQMNRNDELSSILFSIKKNCQFSSKLKTANKMNIENDFIRDENFESIASHAYVNFIVRIKVLSTKKLMFAIQTKVFHVRFDSR